MLRLSFQKVSSKKTGKFGIKYRVVDQSDDLRNNLYCDSVNLEIDSLVIPDLYFSSENKIVINIRGFK